MNKYIFLKKYKLIKINYVFNKSIKYIGLKNLYYPIILEINKKYIKKTISLWNINVFLKSFKRGVHMSRFIYFIEKLIKKPVNIKRIFKSADKFLKIIESINFNLNITFYIFIKKYTPITKIKNTFNYKISFLLKKKNIRNILIYKIIIPVMTLCPCSKTVSRFGAHNQRSLISLYVKSKKKNLLFFIKLVENESSSQLWTIIKRRDEKYLTEFSYNNCKFIEDLIRNLFYKIKKYIKEIVIKIENFESIHNHNVYALLKY